MVWMHVAEDIYHLWGFYEYDDAHFGSVEGGKFDKLSDCLLLKEFIQLWALFDSQNKRHLVSYTVTECFLGAFK